MSPLKDPATEKQIDFLEKLGVSREASAYFTKGIAGLNISTILSGRNPVKVSVNVSHPANTTLSFIKDLPESFEELYQLSTDYSILVYGEGSRNPGKAGVVDAVALIFTNLKEIFDYWSSKFGKRKAQQQSKRLKEEIKRILSLKYAQFNDLYEKPAQTENLCLTQEK